MARIKLTHVWAFSQELSYLIPILKKLDVWISALFEGAQWTLRVISLTNDEGKLEKRLDGR